MRSQSDQSTAIREAKGGEKLKKELAAQLANVPDIDEDETVLEPLAPPREPSQVYSVRIPVDKLELLRRVAAEHHEAPSVLMRKWVLERLEMVAPDGLPRTSNQLVDDLMGRVIYLEQRVAQHQKELDEQSSEHRKQIDTVIEGVVSLIFERFEITKKTT